MTCSKVECNPSKCSRTFLFQPFLTYPPSLIWVLAILLSLDPLLLSFSPPCDWCITPQKLEWCMDLLRAGCQDKAISLSQPCCTSEVLWSCQGSYLFCAHQQQMETPKALEVWIWKGALEMSKHLVLVSSLLEDEQKGQSLSHQLWPQTWSGFCFSNIIQEGAGRNPASAKFSVETLPSFATRFTIVNLGDEEGCCDIK